MTITSWQDLNTLEQALDLFLDTATPKKYSCYANAGKILREVRKELINATNKLEV